MLPVVSETGVECALIREGFWFNLKNVGKERQERNRRHDKQVYTYRPFLNL